MRVAIIGGSGFSTPHLLIDARIVASRDVSFTLYGRSIDHLFAVQRAAFTLAPALASRISLSTNLVTAVTGADVVIVQVRVGGLATREHDELFPLPYGIPGDEGLGPGGFAAAWRSWPVLEQIGTAIVEHSPGARVVLLTAPLGVLARCLIDAFPGLEIVGLCELPTVVLNEIQTTLGAAGFAAEYVGVNHLGWFTRITVYGEDALERYAPTRRTSVYPDERAVRLAKAVPLPYVRLQDRRVEVLEEQRSAALSRAAVLKKIAENTYEAFAHSEASEIRDALAQRPAPWYRYAVVPFIQALRADVSDHVFFLTTRNCGYLPELANDVVLEIPHRFVDGAFVAAPSVETIPPEIAEALRALVKYEAFASEVVRGRDRDRITHAIAAHPWVSGENVADALASKVLSSEALSLTTGPA